MLHDVKFVLTSDRSPIYSVILSKFIAKLTMKVKIRHIRDFRAICSISRFCLLITVLDMRICKYNRRTNMPLRNRFASESPTKLKIMTPLPLHYDICVTVSEFGVPRNNSGHQGPSQLYHWTQQVPPAWICWLMISCTTFWNVNSYGQSANRTAISVIPIALIQSECRSDSRIIRRMNMIT